MILLGIVVPQFVSGLYGLWNSRKLYNLDLGSKKEKFWFYLLMLPFRYCTNVQFFNESVKKV